MPMSETKTVFSIGVSKKYLVALLDCVIRRNDRHWARIHAVTGAISAWIAVGVSFVGSFVIPTDPKDLALGVLVFFLLGVSETLIAIGYRINNSYLIRSETALMGYQVSLMYLDGMAIVRKYQEKGMEPPKDVLDSMQKIQKRYGLPHFNQERDGTDEVVINETLIQKS